MHNIEEKMSKTIEMTKWLETKKLGTWTWTYVWFQACMMKIIYHVKDMLEKDYLCSISKMLS